MSIHLDAQLSEQQRPVVQWSKIARVLTDRSAGGSATEDVTVVLREDVANNQPFSGTADRAVRDAPR